MPAYLMPSEEETRIELTFSDNQEPLVLDAIDVDGIIRLTHATGIPEDSDFYSMFIEHFKMKYGRRLSKSAANRIIEIKADMLNGVKKKSLSQDAPSDSSDSKTDSPTEN